MASPGAPGVGVGLDDFARLQVAQDTLIQDLERKILVSSLVAGAVLRGVVRALSEEAREGLAAKDAQIGQLVQEKDRELNKAKLEYLEKMKEQELCIIERERELSKLAENLVDLTFKLSAESLNSASYEKKMKELQSRDASRLEKIAALTDRLADAEQEQSSAAEMLRRETRIKEAHYREKIEELMAENERQLGVLRAENCEQQALIRSLAENAEEVKKELSQLVRAHRKNLERMKEQQLQQEQELTIIMDYLQEQMLELRSRGGNLREQQVEHEIEADILTIYFTSFIHDQDRRRRQVLVEAESSSFLVEQSKKVAEELRSQVAELWREKQLEEQILVDYLVGFVDESQQQAAVNAGRNRNRIEESPSLSADSYSRSSRLIGERRKLVQVGTEERLLELHHQHELEMDMLFNFFVAQLHEYVRLVQDSEGISSGAHASEMQLQSKLAALKREKEEMLAQKTEEMFRLKRDCYKELDKLRLDGGHYEFGFLKRHFADARHKLDTLLDRSHSESTSNHRFANAEDHSDTDSLSDSATPALERFTGEFPMLVSELQNDIEQLMLDTGMGKPEGRANQADVDELKHDLDVLNSDYDSVCKELEQEKCHNIALTVELQQLEHNISLSNGELGKLHSQLEEEKKARRRKEMQVDNLLHDVDLLKGQLDCVQAQLESQRSQKQSLEADMQKQQRDVELANERIGALERELADVLRLKASTAEEHQRLTREARALRHALSEGIKQQTERTRKHLVAVRGRLEEKERRLLKVKSLLDSYSTRRKLKDLEHKRKLNQYLRNLRKAEEEVDMLGDDNDYLVSLLQSIDTTLDHYAPSLQRCSRILELSKLVKKELASRVEPNAG